VACGANVAMLLDLLMIGILLVLSGLSFVYIAGLERI
jgi:hypothetical protein